MSFENNNLQTEAESILVKKVKDVHGFLETFINNEFLETFHPHLFHVVFGQLLSTTTKSKWVFQIIIY